MSLGLDQLTDDQLLNLMAEGWAEIGSRTEVLWPIWMATKERIEDRARKAAEDWKTAMEMAAEGERQKVRDRLAKEIHDAVADGRIRLLPPEEENRIIAATTASVKIKIIDDLVAALRDGNAPDFRLEVSQGIATLTVGGKVKAQEIRTLESAQLVSNALKASFALA